MRHPIRWFSIILFTVNNSTVILILTCNLYSSFKMKLSSSGPFPKSPWLTFFELNNISWNGRTVNDTLNQNDQFQKHLTLLSWGRTVIERFLYVWDKTSWHIDEIFHRSFMQIVYYLMRILWKCWTEKIFTYRTGYKKYSQAMKILFLYFVELGPIFHVCALYCTLVYHY